jgi:ABC-type phosphonate transport system ATPase subunit
LGLPVQENVPDDLPLAGGHINLVPGSLLVKTETNEPPTERTLGESLHPAQRGRQVVVPEHTSLHHLHVIGPTGSGKSTLLANLITADITAGRSVLVIEPKGDLISDVLARIPADRRDDVVLLEPNPQRSVGVNVLAGEPDQAERRADQIVNLLAELHHGNLGPRSTDVALHALITASRLPDGTLTDVPTLLTNPAFRRWALAQVADPLVLSPWWSWFDGLSDGERGQVVAPLLNKLRAFLVRDALRRMLGQADPKFALDELFAKRRIVLVNTNKGNLGPETSSLLGALLLTQLWAAIQRRSAVAQEQRHPVMVTLDEVQDNLHLPGVDLGDFFAQARGLGVAVTVAHQHLDQLNASQRAGILANARSRVVFRPAPADAKPLAAAMGDALDSSDLLRLRAFEACAQLLVDGQVTRPFSVKTHPLPAWRSDPAALRKLSAERYGVDGAEVDQALAERWQGAKGPDGPVGVKRRRASA